MLVLADAGLFSFDGFNAFAATGADLAWRVGSQVSLGHLRWLADSSYLALIYAKGLGAARRARLLEQANTGQEIPADLARLVRVVEYTVPDRNPAGELIVVVTTILDPHEIGAIELAQAYHQRWEEESALDELKTDLRGRGKVLRSKTPELIEQQLWGLLLAHHAIRARWPQVGALVLVTPGVATCGVYGESTMRYGQAVQPGTRPRRAIQDQAAGIVSDEPSV